MSASRQMPSLTHLDFFGVTADEENDRPRLCEPCIPRVDNKKIKDINKGVPHIKPKVETEDWMSKHPSDRHSNTELIEEKLKELKTKGLLWTSATKNKMEVITRASVLAKLALPYFGMGANSGSYFTYSNKTLRLIGSLRTVDGITLPSIPQARSKPINDDKGHLPAAMITNGHIKDPLVFGKDLVYTLNQLQFKDIGITVSKEVDGQFVGDIKEALNHADDEQLVVAEIKTSEGEPYGKAKWLNIIIKDVALGGTDHLVNLFLSEDAIKKVGIANLRDEEVVKLVEKEFYYIIEEVLTALYSKLSQMRNVKGHVWTVKDYNNEKGLVIHLRIYDGASGYIRKFIRLNLNMSNDDLPTIDGFEPTYINYGEEGSS